MVRNTTKLCYAIGTGYLGLMTSSLTKMVEYFIGPVPVRKPVWDEKHANASLCFFLYGAIVCWVAIRGLKDNLKRDDDGQVNMMEIGRYWGIFTHSCIALCLAVAHVLVYLFP